jgi:hypothetical protein
LLDSEEKDSSITNDSLLSEKSFSSLNIDERDSFLTVYGGETTNSFELDINNVDKVENNLKK